MNNSSRRWGKDHEAAVVILCENHVGMHAPCFSAVEGVSTYTGAFLCSLVYSMRYVDVNAGRARWESSCIDKK